MASLNNLDVSTRAFNESVASMIHKGKILKWYASNHKDLINVKELDKVQYTKYGDKYLSLDEYNASTTLKDRMQIDTFVGTKPIIITGFEYKGFLHFVVEKYQTGVSFVHGVPVPNYENKLVPVSSMAHKYYEFYLARLKYNFGLEGTVAGNKFVETQYDEMKNSMGK